MGRFFVRGVRSAGAARRGRALLTVQMVLAIAAASRPAWATTYDWTGAVNADWGGQYIIVLPFGGTVTFRNWTPNEFPVSATNTELTFQNPPQFPSIFNNLGNPFVLNRMVLGPNDYVLGGGALQFVSNGATAPTISTMSTQQINNALILSDPTEITGSGQLTLGAISGVGFTKSGTGTLTLPAANTYTGNTTIGGGTLRVTGSIATSAKVQVNANATFDAAAAQTVQGLEILGSGKTVVSGSALKVVSGAAPFSIKIGILDGSDSGELDLTTHGLIVDVPPGQESLMRDTIRFYTSVGHATNWQGPGIRSSAAAANPSTGIGYALASEVLGPAGGTFLTLPTDASAVLARFTLLGDATLDGAVDFNDLVRLAQNYNVTDGARYWYDGDNNYDGDTDFNDLVKLAQNYNAALPATAIPGAPKGFEADLVRAFASVPEPGGAICFLFVGSITLTRGRRRR